MNISNKKLRDLQRLIHLIAAPLLALQIYSPLGTIPAFTAVVRYVAIPLAVLTGLVMWQMPVITKFLKGLSVA
jgi:thiosulfate reductase cytochrome b subunit